MPMPKPEAEETHDEFIDRCMGDETMVAEYEDDGQRRAVCETQWDEAQEEDSAPEPAETKSQGRETRILEPEDAEMRVVEADGKPKMRKNGQPIVNYRYEPAGAWKQMQLPGVSAGAPPMPGR